MIGDARLRNRLLIGFWKINHDAGDATAKAFLLDIVDQPAKRFPPALNVGDILRGRPPESVILDKIGLGPGKTTGATKANLDVDGDGTNETYVEPLPGKTGTIMTATATVFQKPDSFATTLSPKLVKGASVDVFGQSNGFYAVRYATAANNVAFVLQSEVNLN
jgi:hypothetical protein